MARSAQRICAIVCRNLGWRPVDFWAATPAEIANILSDPAQEPNAGINREKLLDLMERDDNG